MEAGMTAVPMHQVLQAQEYTRRLLEGGVSFICANCKWAWMGVDANLPKCVILARAPLLCGGPSEKRGFPSYEGPLVQGKGHILGFCFVCGEPQPKYVMKTHDRDLGICKECYDAGVWKGRKHVKGPASKTGQGQGDDGAGRIELADIV